MNILSINVEQVLIAVRLCPYESIKLDLNPLNSVNCYVISNYIKLKSHKNSITKMNLHLICISLEGNIRNI